MVSQRFNSFCIVFTFYAFVMLEVGKAETISSSSSSSSSNGPVVTYGTEINKGELAIKMKFDRLNDGKMHVVISYDTETDAAQDFFQKQFTADLFKKFSDCGVIDWNLMPCGTSKFEKGQLKCPKGDEQCKFDKIHACVASISKLDQQKVGKFIICFFNNNKDVNKCIGDAGLVQKDIDDCVPDEGDDKCNAFFVAIHGKGSQQIIDGSTGSGTTEATTDFKKVLCNQLSQAKLHCDSFCTS